ncbi:hypothetical protein ZWY2020_010954 [Hordeum vulgare]|nr:hypothetical protein ZWY2020_010954 [Hordeum vulgare]
MGGGGGRQPMGLGTSGTNVIHSAIAPSSLSVLPAPPLTPLHPRRLRHPTTAPAPTTSQPLTLAVRCARLGSVAQQQGLPSRSSLPGCRWAALSSRRRTSSSPAPLQAVRLPPTRVLLCRRFLGLPLPPARPRAHFDPLPPLPGPISRLSPSSPPSIALTPSPTLVADLAALMR